MNKEDIEKIIENHYVSFDDPQYNIKLSPQIRSILRRAEVELTKKGFVCTSDINYDTSLIMHSSEKNTTVMVSFLEALTFIKSDNKEYELALENLLFSLGCRIINREIIELDSPFPTENHGEEAKMYHVIFSDDY